MSTITDPLQLQYALFSVVSEVARERQLDRFTLARDDDDYDGEAGDGDTQFASKVRSYAKRQDEGDLRATQLNLGRAYLAELDRRFGYGPATKPPTVTSSPAATPRPTGDGDQSSEAARVALVSLPWMAPTMPSIQLATLAAALRQDGIASDRYELFVDYAELIGINLYNVIGSMLSFTAEWIFARHYFGPEQGEYLEAFWEHRPSFGLPDASLEEEVLDVIGPLTERFLDDALEGTDWSRYDVIGFSLTISQVASSLALARLIKRRFPLVTIVFGGACCAGPMGRAILRIAPCVDAVVHIEGEPVFAELIRRVQAGRSLAGLDGVSFRSGGELTLAGPGTTLYRGRSQRPYLDYDPYFARIERLGLTGRLNVWLPFEGSRGCWYGEKVQCTFCGLHEIMKFRSWTADDVLAELDALYARHGGGRFFAVDLILPKEFFETLLPTLAARERQWMIFYEVKANLSRQEVQLLAAAGIRWIQPGIESLDHDMLRLLKKGVWPVHNIQLLRWCQELGIRVSWNLLTGIPGATLNMYQRMQASIPLLAHLAAPTGCGDLQLHRFSPYFDRPEAYGIRSLGPHPLYKYVFPVGDDDLADLVYLHEFELVQGARSGYREGLQQAVNAWRAANARGAALDLLANADGSATISDTRFSAEPELYPLSRAEAALYEYLDTSRKRDALAAEFAARWPAAARTLGGEGGVAALVARWEAAGLVFCDRGRVLALAVAAGRAEGRADAVLQVEAPVPYLEDVR